MPTGFDHHRQALRGTGFSDDSVIGKILVDISKPTELKVYSKPLAGRKALVVINDSSSFLYLCCRPNFSIAEGNYIWQFPGEEITFEFINGEKIFALTVDYPVPITVMEVAS